MAGAYCRVNAAGGELVTAPTDVADDDGVISHRALLRAGDLAGCRGGARHIDSVQLPLIGKGRAADGGHVERRVAPRRHQLARQEASGRSRAAPNRSAIAPPRWPPGNRQLKYKRSSPSATLGQDHAGLSVRHVIGGVAASHLHEIGKTGPGAGVNAQQRVERAAVGARSASFPKPEPCKQTIATPPPTWPHGSGSPGSRVAPTVLKVCATLKPRVSPPSASGRSS